ncbi:MAG: OmpA family protein [Bacteroidales bacterium]|nr:OmpA family protein [Bacteroidales bacterium]
MRLTILLFFIFSFSLVNYAQSENSDCDFEVSKKATKLYKKAVNALKSGNKSAGAKYFSESIEESPDYLQALWAQARLNKDPHNRYRKEDLAVAAYMRIIEICPSFKSYYSYYYLGVIFYESKQYGKSYKYLEEFLNADGDKIREKHYEDALDLSDYAKFYSEIYTNEVEFNPRKLNAVSSDKDEYLPSLSPDNERVYFTRRSKSSSAPQLRSYSGSAYIEEFCVADRESGLKFDKGKKMAAPFNMQSNEGGAALSIDNTELFYTRCKVKKDKTLNCDICYSRFEYGEWSDIETLGSNINTNDYWESMPTISSDGKLMYFVSDRPGGFGGYDIYRSTRDSTGKWSEAVNMGPSINTAGNEKSPFIHIDRQTLYFSSADRKDDATGEWFAGHMGLGGYDIFYTRLNNAKAWITPKNIGFPINSRNNDLGFFVSIDGKNGFFASNKIGVKEVNVYEQAQKKSDPWNIYTFKLYEGARPQKVLFVKGNLKDEETNEVMSDATIEIKNMETKEVEKIKVNSETGGYAFAMVLKSDYTMVVKKKNYTYVSKYISKTEAKFDVPVKVEVKMQKVKVGKSYNLDDVYFSINSAELNNRSKNVIDGFYDFLIDNPSIIVEIQGHTDNVGNDKFNLILSKDRAKSVYNYLSEKGVPLNQITSKGYGELKPVAPNSTDEGRAKNRRTVFVITDK